MKKIVKKVKKDSRPVFFQIDTYRYLEHCGPSNDDHLGYRNKKITDFWNKNDVIKKTKEILLKKRILSEKNLISIKKNFLTEIENAFKFALKSPFPKKNIVLKNIYKK